MLGGIERGEQPRAYRLRQRRGLALDSRIASSRPRIDAMVRGDSLPSLSDEIVQRLDCRLRVARARQFPRRIARLGAQLPRVVAEKGFQQPQQRSPALHRLAVVVNRDRVGLFPVIERRARLGQDVAGDGPQSLADRNIRTHGGFLGHVKASMTAVCHNPPVPGGHVFPKRSQ